MKQQPRKSSGMSTWLVTFGDLLTLLLCFFIATFATKGSGALEGQKVTRSIHTEKPDIINPESKPVAEREAGTPIATTRSVALCVSNAAQGRSNDEHLIAHLEWARTVGERVRQQIDAGASAELLEVRVGGKGCSAEQEQTEILETKS